MTTLSIDTPAALVTGHSYGDGVTDILEAEGISVIRGDQPLTGRVDPIRSDGLTELSHIEVIVVSHRDSCPAEVISATPRLKGIVSTVIGLETVDLLAANQRDILVAHGAMAENYEGVSEATVMLIAALLLDLLGKQEALRASTNEPGMRGRMVRGKRIGLIGFGRTARGVVDRLQGWGVDVVAYDPYVHETTQGCRMVSLFELVAISDVVSLHVTLTAATRGMIGENELRSMKQDAYLINTSRGAVIDETALVVALREGWIAGAALDVFEEEPLAPDHPLRDLETVILTPHSIGHSQELWDAIPRVAAEQAIAILSDEVPRFVANPEAVSRWREEHSLPNGMS